MSQSIISLSIQNTTPLAQNVSVFNPLPQQESNTSGNATQSSYTYNIQKEITIANIYSYNYISVIYSINGGAYQIATIDYGSVLNSAQKIVNALNSLNQATFFVSGANQITSYSIGANGNNYYYSSISVNGNYTTNSFVGSNVFGIYGSLIYNSGYSLDGTGTITRINTSNTFWINSIPNNISGRLNNCGVWSSNIQTPINSSIGIFSNIYSNTNKIVYIGLSCNTQVGGGAMQLFLNNTLLLNTDNAAMSASINTQIGVNSTYPPYQFWNIYPINLITGNNLINVYNAGNSPTSGIGFEVYDNTAAQIAAATSYAGLNLLYSSSNYTQNMI